NCNIRAELSYNNDGSHFDQVLCIGAVVNVASDKPADDIVKKVAREKTEDKYDLRTDGTIKTLAIHLLFVYLVTGKKITELHFYGHGTGKGVNSDMPNILTASSLRCQIMYLNYFKNPKAYQTSTINSFSEFCIVQPILDMVRNAMSGATIHLHGCQVGQNKEFIQNIANLFQCKVKAFTGDVLSQYWRFCDSEVFPDTVGEFFEADPQPPKPKAKPNTKSFEIDETGKLGKKAIE
ncbi:MAG: hypothetical protein K8S00_05015, partial [Bacteroidales bacterium]|nr:hypothetical protein [Bacteroidales bacterium]